MEFFLRIRLTELLKSVIFTVTNYMDLLCPGVQLLLLMNARFTKMG